jgi:hypothetical protein
MDDSFLGKSYLSIHQVAILKALYGIELSRPEMLAYCEMTEGLRPRKGGYQDAALVCGTRGGKTDLAAIIGTYETVKWGPLLESMLIPGQIATGILVAENRRQAGIVRGYIEGNFHTLEEKGIEVLARTHAQEKAVTGDCIKTVWPLEIVIYPASKAAMRGVTGLWFIADEIAWWESAEGAYNQDTEVIRAARSRFATLARIRPKRILLSSPNAEQGVLWDEYCKRASNRTMVVQAPSWLLNPTIPQEFLDTEQEKDAEAYNRDYAAIFSKVGGGNTFLPGEIVDQCVDRGRQQVPPKAGYEYLAFIDAAFKRDRFSFAIGHRENDGSEAKVIIDHSRHWTPPKGKPLNDTEVVAEIVGDLRPYGIDRVHGDQFADIPLKTSFKELGVAFVEMPITSESKYDMYKNMRAALRAGMVSLPDDAIVIRDLKSLVKKETPTGKASVHAPKRKGSYDDAAVVVSQIVAKLMPLAFKVDLRESNAMAVAHLTNMGLDWRQPQAEGEFGGRLMEAVY